MSSWQWMPVNSNINATCTNITELKDVIMITFITQLVGTICVVISSCVSCLNIFQPCKKSRITPEEFAEAYQEYVISQNARV
jgi:hypothetical protein